MHEHLQIHIALRSDLPDLGQRHLTRQHNPAGTEFLPGIDGCPVRIVGLCTDVKLHIRDQLAAHHEYTQIGYQQGIRLNALQILQIVRQALKITIMREDIHGHIDLLSPGLREIHCFLEFFPAEITAESPQAKGFATQIDRICAIQHRHLQFFQVPCRGQQLRLFDHESISSLSRLIHRRAPVSRS